MYNDITGLVELDDEEGMLAYDLLRDEPVYCDDCVEAIELRDAAKRAGDAWFWSDVCGSCSDAGGRLFESYWSGDAPDYLYERNK